MRGLPAVLIILDGWGIAAPSRGNAISLAQTPVFDSLVTTYPTMSVQAAGEAVGLPWGEVGNSEVGHLNIGAGKILYQDLPRITHAITNGSFYDTSAFLAAIHHAHTNNSALHLAGLVSNGGVHSFNEHLYALLELCSQQKMERVYIHAFLDGRDTPYNSGKNFLAKLQKEIERFRCGAIATIAGRYFAMDRDHHWDRTEKTYRAIARGLSDTQAADPQSALDASYKKGIFDEECVPTVIIENGKPAATVQPHDALVFFNFRSDRMRQITKAFALAEFSDFERGAKIDDLLVVTMTEYEAGLPVTVAFPPEHVNTPLAKVLSDNGLKQLHIAETEKYAHVTFFLNGGKEEQFPNEERILIPSPSVSSFDQKPDMSTRPITERVVTELQQGKADCIIVNFANVDMVGHTGNLPAVIRAVQTLDACIGAIVNAALAKDGTVFITADHGNAEEVMNLQTGVINKEHSNNPVPFIVVHRQLQGKSAVAMPDLSRLRPSGMLSDVAPTMLAWLAIPMPADMTGRNLLML